MARLLIVEDRKMSLEMVEKTIKSWNLFGEIDSVDSFEGAVAMLSRNEYDCILLDLQIWDMAASGDGTHPVGDEASAHHGVKLLGRVLPKYAEKLYIFSAHVDEVGDDIAKLGMIDRLLPRPVKSSLLKEKLTPLAEGTSIG